MRLARAVERPPIAAADAAATTSLRIGTRGSALALAQSGIVAESLASLEPALAIELVAIRTAGDEDGTGAPSDPAVVEDKSRFIKEIEEALLDGRVDLAVHSAKDVPGDLPPGLAVVGVPARAAAADVLCGPAALADLPDGAVVGTSSLRRRAQLLALRPELDVRELHGNVDTRLRRLERGDYGAIVLAAAGLARLGLEQGSALDVEQMTPAPGQGCLALEARSGDERAMLLAERATDRASLLCLTAERAVAAALGASCRTPVGAHAEPCGDQLRVSAFVGLPDGSAWIRDALAGLAADPGGLGRAVAERLLAAGAAELIAEAERWT